VFKEPFDSQVVAILADAVLGVDQLLQLRHRLYNGVEDFRKHIVVGHFIRFISLLCKQKRQQINNNLILTHCYE
jgi:hypothetical protein